MKLSATTQRLGKMEGRIVLIGFIQGEVLDQCLRCTLSIRYGGPPGVEWVVENDLKRSDDPPERGTENCKTWLFMSRSHARSNAPVS
jgi:hypothetical protein